MLREEVDELVTNAAHKISSHGFALGSLPKEEEHWKTALKDLVGNLTKPQRSHLKLLLERPQLSDSRCCFLARDGEDAAPYCGQQRLGHICLSRCVLGRYRAGHNMQLALR